MFVKDFLKLFNFSNLELTHLIIIPIEENNFNLIKNPKNCLISSNRKIRLDDSNNGFVEDYEYFVETFKIKAKRQSNDISAFEYELVDFEEIGNNFYFILDKNNEGWLIYEIN